MKMEQAIPEIKIEKTEFEELNIPFGIPKSRSLNFEICNNTNEQRTQNIFKDELNRLNSKYGRAEYEIEKLKRENELLASDIDSFQKIKDLVYLNIKEEEKNKYRKLKNQYRVEILKVTTDLKSSQEIVLEQKNHIEYLTEELLKLKKNNEKTMHSFRSKNSELKKKLEENEKIFSCLTQEETLRLENYHVKKSLEIECSSYDEFKKIVFENNDFNNNNPELLTKLESICQTLFMYKQKVKDLELEKISISKDLNEKLDSHKSYAIDLSKALVEKKKLEKTLKENSEYIEIIDKNLEQLNEKLQTYETNFTTDNLNIFKSIFIEFNECLKILKEISHKSIENDSRIPYQTYLMRNENFFSICEDASIFDILNFESLTVKLNEIAEIKRSMNLLKIDMGLLHPVV